MCANWAQDNRDMSPDRNNHYQIDNVRLQMGLGVQLLGVSLRNMPNPLHMYNGNRGRGGHRRNQHHQKPNHSGMKLEIQRTWDGTPIRKLYITNICIETYRPEILKIFGQFGQIHHIYIGVLRNNNSKQFAFITFEDPLDAARVLYQQKFKDMRGRTLYAMAADSWHQPLELPDGTIDWRTRKNPAWQEEDGEQAQDEEQSSEVTTSRVETEINEGSLNMLNDDCLLHIFSFLSFQQITAVERVCKRWQALSYRMWSCLRTLNFRHDSPFAKTTCNTKVLDQYLKRCGSSLTSLYLTNKKHDFGDATLAVVAKYCENLEVLGVNDIAVATRSLAYLGRSCPRLQQLCLDGCEKVNDDELNSLLPKCANLRVLEVANIHRFTGKCLANVQGPVTKLRLSELSKMDPDHLISGLRKMSSSLESITLNACTPPLRTHDVVKKIVLAVPNITSISLSHCMMEFNSQCLSPLGQLKKLTSLNLYLNNAVNDTSLAAIVEGCEELVSLNLCGSGGGCAGFLTERGISMLARLHKLTHLNISYLEATNNMALKNFTARNCKLKSLECRGCPELGDEGTETVVTVCNELELFDVSGCNGVSDKTVQTAMTSVKMRTNNTPLRIVMGGTQVQPSSAYGDVPLFTIDYRDLSEEHMRPDFMDDMFFPPSDSDEDDDLEHLCERIGCDCDFDFDDLFDPTLVNDETQRFAVDFDVEESDDWSTDDAGDYDE